MKKVLNMLLPNVQQSCSTATFLLVARVVFALLLASHGLQKLEGFEQIAVSTCKCTARKVKEYFRKNTQAGYENLIFLSGDGLFCQQLC